MSAQKLTIVVTCTDRKSAPPTADLMARHLPAGPVDVRARLWTSAVKRSRPTIPLEDLYQGETWSQVKRLIGTARDLGHDAEVLVASAGLGLRSLHEDAPAYAATFSPGHLDSVAASRSEARTWWQALPQTTVVKGRSALCILSETYSRAVGADLIQTLEPSQLLVFGGSKGVADDVRVPSDRSLRRALGGTVTSLNVRSAIQWLLLSRRSGVFGSQAENRWRDWSDGARHHEQYNRTPLSDSAVIEYVRTLLRRNPALSKTCALRALRADGLACEQRRFSALFQQVMKS